MRSARPFGAALVLVAAGVLFAALAGWTMVARSTIPTALDGTVTKIEVRPEKHPGVDDVWMVSIDGEARHLDRAVAELLTEGTRVRKDAWDTRLVVGDQVRTVALSRDAERMLFLAPGIAGGLLVLLVVVVRKPRGAD